MRSQYQLDRMQDGLHHFTEPEGSLPYFKSMSLDPILSQLGLPSGVLASGFPGKSFVFISHLLKAAHGVTPI
jgi:hypothetical protein